MHPDRFEISGTGIGGGAKPYLIAELGINHGGDLDVARKLLRAARDAGADAAKLQAFVPELFLSRSSPYFDLLASCALSPDAVKVLMKDAAELGITLFSAVFDEASADMLAGLGAPAFKIASGDLTHIPLLRHVAAFGRPMLISTGGANIGDISAALQAVHDVSPDLPVALFHCVSNYPTDPGNANLACMATMRDAFGLPVGFSDHTRGNATAVAAAALGAQLIEKHFTLDCNAPGPDHSLSSDPAGFRQLADDIDTAWRSIGRAQKAPVEDPGLVGQIRRSVTAMVAIPKGTVIRGEMLAVKRPGTGIQPCDIGRVIGSRAGRDIAVDETIAWDSLD